MTKEITTFLLRWETRQLQGYIPCKRRNFTGLNKYSDCGEVIASSGVTIGTGVDLGQQSAGGLLKMGLPSTLISKFGLYLGKSKIDAVSALTRLPIRLTEQECDTLDAAVHTRYISQARDRFNAASLLDFDSIPVEAQTAIVSLGYQLGSPSKYPKTWTPLVRGDWKGAAWELQNGFQKYANRRKEEGDLLLQIKE